MTLRPFTAVDLLSFPEEERARLFRTIAQKRCSGEWDYPIPTSGDFATMTPDDVVYWLHKAEAPVRRAVRDSGLERYFQLQVPLSLPDGFTSTDQLTLAAAGDLMDHDDLPRSGSTLYPAIASMLFGADICTANLECIVTNDRRTLHIKTSEAPILTFREGSFESAIEHAGRAFTFVSTACNHSLDCGVPGLRSTQDALDARGVAYHGTYRDEAASRRARIVECRGFRVGMISHTFGLNGHVPPPDQPWVVSRTHLNGAVGEVDLTQLSAQLAHCRAEGVDFVIGHLHWGLEHEFYPRPTQLKLAHHLAELGLDLIIGHHPHVLQPVEHYRTRRDPNRIVPIYYSLGNLINPFAHPAFRIGGIAQLSLARGHRNGVTSTYVQSTQLTEVFQEHDAEHETLRIVVANDEQRSVLPWMSSKE